MLAERSINGQTPILRRTVSAWPLDSFSQDSCQPAGRARCGDFAIVVRDTPSPSHPYACTGRFQNRPGVNKVLDLKNFTWGCGFSDGAMNPGAGCTSCQHVWLCLNLSCLRPFAAFSFLGACMFLALRRARWGQGPRLTPSANS